MQPTNAGLAAMQERFIESTRQGIQSTDHCNDGHVSIVSMKYAELVIDFVSETISLNLRGP